MLNPNLVELLLYFFINVIRCNDTKNAYIVQGYQKLIICMNVYIFVYYFTKLR